MAKFCGNIGFSISKETKPGIWDHVIEEHKYYGDVLRSTRRWEHGEYLNDDLNVSNNISIIADPFARDSLSCICYVEWMKTKWKVTDVEVEYPRLILTIGGVYNEDSTSDL